MKYDKDAPLPAYLGFAVRNPTSGWKLNELQFFSNMFTIVSISFKEFEIESESIFRIIV